VTPRVSKLAAFIATVAFLMLGVWCQGQPRFLTREASLRNVVSGPFVFTTDLAANDVEDISAELLALERRITAELKLPRLAVPVRVYPFQTKARYLSYLQQHFPALHRSASGRRAIFLLRDGAPHIFVHNSADLRGDIRHEFTHALLNTSVRGLPLWLDEGLAEFYGAPDGSGYQAAHANLVRSRIRQGGTMGLARLESLTDHQQMGKLEYATAWSWAHFLLRGPAEVRNVVPAYLTTLRSDSPGEQIQTRVFQCVQNPYQSWRSHLDKLTSPSSTALPDS